MTNEIINKMVEEINGWIKLAYDEFQTNGRSTWYLRTTDRINGMCQMLKIVSGKVIYWDDNGVKMEEV